MATIHDVAKLAEVSVATVSRVLNNRGYVGAETRKRVEEAIRELNYRPNKVARSLFKKKTTSIGCIIPDITNPFFPQLVKAVEQTLNEHGYTVLLFNSEDRLDRMDQILEVLQTEYVAGALIVSDQVKKKHLDKLDIPVVAIDKIISTNISSVTVNNYENAREAVRYLVGRGCRKIAHLRGPVGVYTSEERLRGYQDEMTQQGLPSYIANGHYQLSASIQATMELLQQHPDLDGIFAANDIMAVGAIKALARLGIRIPDEIKVIGFDGIEWGMTITPELTTMEQPIVELGNKSAELLLQIINGQVKGPKHYRLDAKLVVRDST